MRGTGRSRWRVAAVMMLVMAVSPVHAQEATPTPAPAIPFAGLTAEAKAAREKLDAATARAVELEDRIAELEAEGVAIGERLTVTADRIRRQRLELEQAEARRVEARERFARRLVTIYKHGTFDPLSLILSAESLPELFNRATTLSRIAEEDGRVVADLNIAVADERYQARALDDLLSQDVLLKAEQTASLAAHEAALREQQALIDRLTAEARAAVQRARAYNATTRRQWTASTIPVGSAIPRATATVAPYEGVMWEVSAYMPRAYDATGQRWNAVCSWYGPGFNGRTTASGQVFNEDDLTCASRTLPFGTVLALSRGERRIIVYVNDRGPYVAGRDLDLSRAAAAALGFGGVATVQAEVVIPVR